MAVRNEAPEWAWRTHQAMSNARRIKEQRKMNDQFSNQDTFAPIVFGESNQAKQIAHFQTWVRRVSEERLENYCELLCRGFTKFIELDLLRYGRKPGSFTWKRGFGVVRQSSVARSFIESEIMPMDL